MPRQKTTEELEDHIDELEAENETHLWTPGFRVLLHDRFVLLSPGSGFSRLLSPTNGTCAKGRSLTADDLMHRW